MLDYSDAGLECDLTPLITSTSLLVEDARDALKVLWLVECGLLPPLRRPLSRKQAEWLGHGNVMVWLDNQASSLDGVTVRMLNVGLRVSYRRYTGIP